MNRLLAAAAATAVGVLLPALPVTTAGAQEQPTPVHGLLERAADAAQSLAFEGTMVIIAFDRAGPSVSEIELMHGPDGELQMSGGTSWMVGRSGGDAFLWEPRAGRVLHFVGMDSVPFSVDLLMDNYQVTRAGTRRLMTGPATVLAVRQQDARHDREHLYLDQASDLIVRRDTFQDDGSPARVVAFTDIDVAADPGTVTSPPAAETDGASPRKLDDHQLRVLESTGWVAPQRLPGGYHLRSGYAVPEPDTGSLHLVYSDGLYTLSLYQQRGQLRADELTGAVAARWGDMQVHRWPGAQPARIVWSGGGLVFTVVTDAPHEQALAAATALPQDPPPSLAERLLDGVGRAAGRLWPFG